VIARAGTRGRAGFNPAATALLIAGLTGFSPRFALAGA